MHSMIEGWYIAEGSWKNLNGSIYFEFTKIKSKFSECDAECFLTPDYVGRLDQWAAIYTHDNAQDLEDKYKEYYKLLGTEVGATLCVVNYSFGEFKGEAVYTIKKLNTLIIYGNDKWPWGEFFGPKNNYKQCCYWTCALKKRPDGYVEPTEPEEPSVTDPYFVESEWYMTTEDGYALDGSSFEKYMAFLSTQGYNKDSAVYHKVQMTQTTNQFINATSLVKGTDCEQYAAGGTNAVVKLTKKFTTSEGEFYSTGIGDVTDVYQDTDLDEEELPW